MFINPKFSPGEIVTLVTDQEEKPRVVTALVVVSEEHIYYELSNETFISRHYDHEIKILPFWIWQIPPRGGLLFLYYGNERESKEPAGKI